MNDLQLDYPFVSQWHAIIRFDEDNIDYVDLGSTNGTCINSMRIEKNSFTPVAPDAELTIFSLIINVSRFEPISAEDGVYTYIGAAPAARVHDIYASRFSSDPQGEPEPVFARPDEFIDDEISALAQQYDGYRSAWHGLLQEVIALVENVEEPQKLAALLRLQEKYPELTNEPEFQRIARDAGVSANSGAEGDSLTRLAEAFLPARRSFSPDDQERFAAQLAAVLESFGKTLIELLKGHQEFREQMGFNTIVTPSSLQRTREARDLLAYLLDWGEDADDRRQELISAFADLMIHQVAMVSGVVDGAKGMLAQLSPAAIIAQARAYHGFWGKLLPFRSSRYWKLFSHRFQQLSQDDSQVTRALFGPAFLRSYATIVGQKLPDETAENRY